MAVRDGRGRKRALPHLEFLHVDWSVSGIEAGRGSDGRSFFSLKPIPMKTGATRDPHWHSRLTAVLQFSPQRSASFNNNSNRHLAILTSIRLSCNYDPTDHLVEKVSTGERSVSNGFYWSKVNEANCGSSFSIILTNGRSNFGIG
ncbi:hypothetical protein ALC56_05463 [Trachymyrmex septentrionalis]|uniref:Uncharacterized protein n=1 Tax=Trachymyrmex septentrionalis TaxID=34720 RepID=A0A195FJE0_9HYME|nr:hypothetical protein ALC56_05463 [Trachymyrmex septentrionalis]